MGGRLLQQLAEDSAEFGSVESSPRIDGRNMVMVIAPLKHKSEAKAEQNARRAEEKASRRQDKGDEASAE
ncbi:MAG: translation initiation factor IF-3, partial [Leucobacter sp.]|nr:translation initiation factor IF-3 [Leucobacter sp.]